MKIGARIALEVITIGRRKERIICDSAFPLSAFHGARVSYHAAMTSFSRRALRTALSFALVAPTVLAIYACKGSSDSGAASCQGFYDSLNAFSVRCGLGETSHNLAAAIRSCQVTSSAPGANYQSLLDTCSSAVQTAACDALDTLTDDGGPCSTPAGTLMTGAGCVSGSQCATSACTQKGTTTGKPSYCGACGPTAGVGQACSISSSAALNCAKGTSCVVSTNDAGSTTSFDGTCLVVTKGAAGAACDNQAARCEPALNCVNKKCVVKAKPGESCLNARCVSTAFCSSTSQVCITTPLPGQPCPDKRCVGGSACLNNVCTAITYAAAGAACDGMAARCFEGSCILGTSTTNDTNSGDAGSTSSRIKTCPDVIAEGSPCNSSDRTKTCPAPTSCYDGICQIADPSKCL